MQITDTITTARRAGVRKAKKHSLRTDMTPMVDLGFLLITFFVMTAELSKPKTMDLVMPTNKPGPQTKLAESAALTVLVDANKVYLYEGSFSNTKGGETIKMLTNGLRSLRLDIRNKQQRMDASGGDRKALMVLVKASEDATYSSVIDVLDEMLINGVEKYALVEITDEEEEWIAGSQR